MLKTSASLVLARHCTLTVSAAFTNVVRGIQRNGLFDHSTGYTPTCRFSTTINLTAHLAPVQTAFATPAEV